MPDIEAKGLAELQATLDDLPAKVEARLLRGGLGAAARVVANEAKNRVARQSGKLLGSIRVSSRIDTRSGQIVAKVIAGRAKAKDDPYYAQMVEYGTKAHAIHAKDGGALTFGNFFGSSVHHPGAKPKPYLRPAADATTGEATQAFAEYIETKLEKLQGP